VRAVTGWSPSAFELQRDSDGAPSVKGPDLRAVAVSLTHMDGGAIAVAGIGPGRIGVDAEPVVLRSAAFVRTWLTPLEQARDGHCARSVTRDWCAKEAVLKALGTGLKIHPREVEVTRVVGHRLHITVMGEAADRMRELGGSALVCTRAQLDGVEVVVASLRCHQTHDDRVRSVSLRRRTG
jgi:phosphopantetheinyl transferase